MAFWEKGSGCPVETSIQSAITVSVCSEWINRSTICHIVIRYKITNFEQLLIYTSELFKIKQLIVSRHSVRWMYENKAALERQLLFKAVSQSVVCAALLRYVWNSALPCAIKKARHYGIEKSFSAVSACNTVSPVTVSSQPSSSVSMLLFPAGDSTLVQFW